MFLTLSEQFCLDDTVGGLGSIDARRLSVLSANVLHRLRGESVPTGEV